MFLFYCPDIIDKKGQLPPDESMHCIKVLRCKNGDRIRVTDGKGSIYEAVITSDRPGKCAVEMIRRTNEPVIPSWTIHIAIAPTKNISRFEWFLEKSVELGIDTITPLICSRSERRVLKEDRLNRLIISTMKQAIVPRMPAFNEPEAFKAFIDREKHSTAMKFIGHCGDQERKWLKEAYVKGSDSIILIGPEGDFSPDEIRQAEENGFIPVALSKNRLRVETAGIVACHTINLLNEDLPDHPCFTNVQE
ncbi:MAG: 16S rRNA (uracil(1498)-N(3))-methyltransferase [Bacteroidales bacterium]|nr:16S rRNA (uracil(1498)-N(3))-methyltransferase [Bacteroidales bacterium]